MTDAEPSGVMLRGVELPYSEVCMHMRIAGTRMDVELLPTGMAQLWTTTGEKFSFPITRGEAGVSDALATLADLAGTGTVAIA